MDDAPTVEAAEALERRAADRLAHTDGDARREIESALDQLRADRANGETLAAAVRRLSDALVAA